MGIRKCKKPIFFSPGAECVGLSLSTLRAASGQMHNVLGCKQVPVPSSGEPHHGFPWVSQITKCCRKGLVKALCRIGEIPAQITGLYCMSLLPYIFSNTALYTEHTAVFRKLILSYSTCRWQMIGKKCNEGKFFLAYAKLTGVRLFWNSGALVDIRKSKVTACQERFCTSVIAE